MSVFVFCSNTTLNLQETIKVRLLYVGAKMFHLHFLSPLSSFVSLDYCYNITKRHVCLQKKVTHWRGLWCAWCQKQPLPADPAGVLSKHLINDCAGEISETKRQRTTLSWNYLTSASKSDSLRLKITEDERQQSRAETRFRRNVTGLRPSSSMTEPADRKHSFHSEAGRESKLTGLAN